MVYIRYIPDIYYSSIVYIRCKFGISHIHIHVHMELFICQRCHILGIFMVYTINVYGIYAFSGFRGQHHSRPDPVPQDIPDDVPDPDDLADFELPDPQASIHAFLDGLCKESDHEFRGLSD